MVQRAEADATLVCDAVTPITTYYGVWAKIEE